MLGRFVRLPGPERTLLLRVVVVLTVVRIALWLVPFFRIHDVCRRRFASTCAPTLRALPLERLAWAVQTASRAVPAASCLTQSLALQFLLTQLGRTSALLIGVATDRPRGFEAHAWVECAGQVLLDHPDDVAMYTVLATFDAP